MATMAFKPLRGYIYLKGHDQATLCKILNKSSTYVSMRMQSKFPWTMEDIEKMVVEYSIPTEQVFELFKREK